ncbi:MAG TPA: sugar ABC transporter substrate-binding protein [Candidatus Limnocylindrales bacterium]|nr:sugar ABC transporter substrate-binding protein [Candidatus Limnocylindrales bacterium]HEU4919611.1 sugar ABC transporter substrate-binding protein [Candidatus Limnocylindrales bacterium]
MKSTRWLAVALVAMLAAGACTSGAAPSASAPASPSSAPTTAASPSEAPSTNPEAVIPNVEDGAEITFWTFYLSPTFDDYIKATIDRFEETYPGVTVKWEDHQATFLDDYRNAFAAGNAPDVANLSNNEGWVREFAEKDLLLSMTDNLPAEVIDDYFPDLFNDSLVDGKSYQVPWYQAVPVELVNTEIFEAAGLSLDDFPDTWDGIPELCQTIKDATGKLCDIRLTVNDYLAQMVYEGGVDVINDDGSEFTFDSTEAVEWLQTYVDMVAAGTVDRAQLVTADDRTALELFTSGQAPFYNTGPQLIREVKSSNPALYEKLAIAPFPVGRSGVIQPTSMAISVKADTEFPNASMALAVFFTNPISEVEFSKTVAVYPSTIAAFDDAFFTEEPELIEDSARPLAKDIISKMKNIMPSIPEKADVNAIVGRAVESALFNNVPAQQALSDAVAEANALLE